MSLRVGLKPVIDERSNLLYLDCHDFLRSLAMTMTIKDNFAILNLVKTFLTSITFDSLSRKIKNPCLVINKIYLKGVCKMTHTKNILKSLLITVMALSLLAVSCKKDENGGGGKTPTNPLPSSTTITAQNITDAIKSLASKTIGDTTIDFSGFTTSSAGNANLNATVTKALTDFTSFKTSLKSELEKVTVEGATVTVGEAQGTSDVSTSDAVTIDISIEAKDKTFAEDVSTAYTVTEKTAKVTISITPADSKKWNETSTPAPSVTKIEGTTIAEAIKNLGTDIEVATAKVNFQTVSEIKETIDLTATKGTDATVVDTFKTDMKAQLEKITITGATVTIGEAGGTGAKDNKDAITFEITIKANENYELDSTIKGYQLADKSVKFTVSVTPSENWG